MKKWWFFLLLTLLFLGYFITTPKHVLFYDAPEYVGIVTNNSFFRTIGMGHTPIHPTFIGALWVLVRVIGGIWDVEGIVEYAANIANLLIGITSVVLFFKLSRYYFNGLKRYLATILFVFFPGIWIINTNLHVETLALTFYLAALLCIVKYIKSSRRLFLLLFELSLILLLTTHIVALVWIPSLFAIVFFIKRESAKGEPKNSITIITIATSLSVLFSFLLYGIVFYFSGKPVIQSLNHLVFEKVGDVYDYSFIGLGRIIRNISLELLRGYGSLTVLMFAVALVKLLKNKTGITVILGFLLLGASLFFSGGAWTGDFMVKRMVFMTPIVSIILVKKFPKWSTLLVIYLTPIVIANGLLYLSNKDGYPLQRMQEMHDKLPKGSMIVQTNFVSPFVDQEKHEYAWTGSGYISKIERAFDEEKEVFLDSQGLFAPYMQYTGNNLHVTSLGRFGESESKSLFAKYYFDIENVGDAEKRLFVYRLRETRDELREMKEKTVRDSGHNVIKGNTDPGSAVIIYSNKLSERIRRERVDYGDPLLWIWVVATGRHEPVGWTYSDREGVFVYPIDNKNKGSIIVRDEYGEKLEFSYL